MKDFRTKNRIRYAAVFIGMGILLFVLFLLGVRYGSVPVTMRDIFRAIFFGNDGSSVAYIILRMRLPRVCVAIILGGALGLSGFLIQTFFRNPIASPFVLGISSGAEFTVALTTIVLANVTTISIWGSVLAAFVGSMISMGFVLLCPRKMRSITLLLVIGIMIGYICGALTDLLMVFADEEEILDLFTWNLGSFAVIGWEKVIVMSVIVFPAFLATFFLSKPIGAYQLGEGYALSMGTNIRFTRIAIIVLSSILSATVVAFAGPISFVGIAVPHIMRMLMKTSKPIVLIPGSFLFGSVFCLFCDLISRVVLAPSELAVGTVTAIFGAPVVIYILLSRRGNRM